MKLKTRFCIGATLVLWCGHGFGQNLGKDSVQTLNEVTVTTLGPLGQSTLKVSGAQSLITKAELERQSQSALVGALNLAPGVRMEERSPGSYRLSLRGSLLRSPFGIRNVKVYLDDFPLTDAGGNTYLNLVDAGIIHSISILKGPQSSIFGANTGGAVLIETTALKAPKAEMQLTGGSYGLFHQTGKINYQLRNYKIGIIEGYQRSDGYRANSALNRTYIQTSHQWDYSPNAQLKVLMFYSDLAYKTPGGLTLAQQSTNPRAARPSTPVVPGAVEQQAAIYNRTLFGGIAHRYNLSHDFQFLLAVFGNYTDFKNPFITNFERRNEATLGVRSYVRYTKASGKTANFDLFLGIESASTKTELTNFGNLGGIPTALLAHDKLTARQDFVFVKSTVELWHRLAIEVGASLNLYGYTYQSLCPVQQPEGKRNFKAALMPKLAASYQFGPGLSWTNSIAKGYSPPTIAEVRASDQLINTNLQAEAGWNYETGLAFSSRNKRLALAGNVFYFQLDQAIVRRLTATDAEYFVNAGGTRQLGTEWQSSWRLIEAPGSNFIDGVHISASYTYNHFKFGNFSNDNQDFSGNWLTGVPKHVLVGGLNITFTKGLYLYAQHNFTSAIPLNDGNSVYSKNFHLSDLNFGLKDRKLGQTRFDLFGGINNVFDVNYSLGNDLNAANGRYYNPAPGTNYFIGARLKIN